MFPSSLLRAAQGSVMLVELKNGETFNGTLESCDSYMNMNLSGVIRTSADGASFWKMEECYVRGHNIKYVCVPDELIDRVPEEDPPVVSRGPPNRGGRGQDREGSRGGRGRGRGGNYQNRGNGDRDHQRNRGGRGGDRGRGRGAYRGGRS